MSVIESIQGLTPILAIPLYAEQQATAQRLQAHGIAWQLPYEELSYDGILYGIRKLTSGSYKANLRQLKKQLTHLLQILTLNIHQLSELLEMMMAKGKNVFY